LHDLPKCLRQVFRRRYGAVDARVRAPQNFPRPAELPAPDRHILYDQRVADIADSVPKLGGSWASEAYVTRSILAGLFGRTRAA